MDWGGLLQFPYDVPIHTLKPVRFLDSCTECMVRYPFLISIPHGGMQIPEELKTRIALEQEDIRYYGDPDTCRLFDFRGRVERVMDTGISRMIVDLNRPPYALPPRHTDGAIKFVTPDARSVYHPRHDTGYHPNAPPHDVSLLSLSCEDRPGGEGTGDSHRVRWSQHASRGTAGNKGCREGKARVCLGNNGDRLGRAKKGRLSTCSAEWMHILSESFREESEFENRVAINDPFSGGFITNAHYWHTGIPFVQIEINRALYECQGGDVHSGGIRSLQSAIWSALARFWDAIDKESVPG
jgi:N-formylglutamate amidohydrolase